MFGHWTKVILIGCVLSAWCLADLLGLSPLQLQQAQSRWGNSAATRLLAWNSLTQSLRGRPEREQIDAVNFFVDTLPYISDAEHWHQEDYWATPYEMIGSDGGDCEDYALAKYFTLRTLGVPDSHLRMTYVEALSINQPHMVLAWYPTPGAEPMILDSLTNKILPASQRTDLLPIYSFNVDGMWVSGEDDQGEPAENDQGLDKWQDVLVRMHNQPGSYYPGFPVRKNP